MDADLAEALAERLHHGQRDVSGAPLIDHVRRVAAAVPREARAVAWLHEVLEYGSASEEALLAEGLSPDELRALRLLTRVEDGRSNTSYLAHVELIARANGAGASLARTVKRADLADRALNPLIRADRWSPPYELGLEILNGAPPPDARAPCPSLPSGALAPTTAAAGAVSHASPANVADRAGPGTAKPRLGSVARPPVTPVDEHDLPRADPEFHARRLGSALRRLAAELVDERRKVAELRREVAELRSRIEALQTPQGRHEAAPGGTCSRPGSRDARPRSASTRSDLAGPFNGEAR